MSEDEIEIIKQRYARGEISRNEYLRLRSDLEADGKDHTKMKKKPEASGRAALINHILVAAVIILVVGELGIIYFITSSGNHVQPTTLTTTSMSTLTSSYNIQGPLITPNVSLADAPVITTNQTFGVRLTGLNAPLNSTELAVINNASDAYFQIAGNMLLNKSLTNIIGTKAGNVSQFFVNGKTSVIYFCSITAIYCAENKWAMALALSRFGSFSQLFKGYSSLQDGDVPTLYWAPAEYDVSATGLGAFYTSNYINFLAIEDTNPITGGFMPNPTKTIASRINATGNLVYIDAFNIIRALNNNTNYIGVPYTVWGAYSVPGADAVDFGNTTPTSTNDLPITRMTHDQILAQLSNPQSQFALTEYAAADLYVAMLCNLMDNTPPICSLPAIIGINVGGS